MKKILLIRLSSMGDIVLTSPLIRCIKQQIPDAELHYACREQYLPVIAHNPYIDRIHIFSKKLEEIIPSLQAENFYYIIDLHKNLRSRMLRKKLPKPVFSFPKLNFHKWLLVNFRINLLPDIHIVDRYFMAVSALGVKNDGLGLEHFIHPDDETFPDAIPTGHREAYIGFVIGGNHPTKILPAEKIISICRKIEKPVLLLGGIGDRKKGEYIYSVLGSKIFNACGLYQINQSAFLVKKADCIITHDTGMMHIAAAYHKMIISIWGNTIPEFGMYPYLSKEVKDHFFISEVKNLSCRPCSKLGYKACPAGHFKCMELQDVEAIAAKANQ